MNSPDLCQGTSVRKFDRNFVESLRNTDFVESLRNTDIRRMQDSTKFLSCFVHLNVHQEISYFLQYYMLCVTVLTM